MKILLKTTSVISVALFASSAFALPALPGRFSSFYAEKGIDVTELAARSCALCHAGAFPNAGNLNGFGRDVQENVQFRARVVDFSPIEDLDSDNDTFDNITEISSGTLPGDASSVPAAE